MGEGDYEDGQRGGGGGSGGIGAGAGVWNSLGVCSGQHMELVSPDGLTSLNPPPCVKCETGFRDGLGRWVEGKRGYVVSEGEGDGEWADEMWWRGVSGGSLKWMVREG